MCRTANGYDINDMTPEQFKNMEVMTYNEWIQKYNY